MDRIEEMLTKPYHIIDVLPERVPAGSPGQYFAVEKYLMTHQSSAIRQKHIHTILKINCYYDISIDGILNPPPEQIRETRLGDVGAELDAVLRKAAAHGMREDEALSHVHAVYSDAVGTGKPGQKAEQIVGGKNDDSDN